MWACFLISPHHNTWVEQNINMQLALRYDLRPQWEKMFYELSGGNIKKQYAMCHIQLVWQNTGSTPILESQNSYECGCLTPSEPRTASSVLMTWSMIRINFDRFSPVFGSNICLNWSAGASILNRFSARKRRFRTANMTLAKWAAPGLPCSAIWHAGLEKIHPTEKQSFSIGECGVPPLSASGEANARVPGFLSVLSSLLVNSKHASRSRSL